MEAIEVRATVRQAERTASRVLDGHAVVVVLDAQRLHTLNEVGTRVWELCDGRTIESIAREIVADFEVSPEIALADTTRFVEELRSLGAVEVAPP